MTIAVDNSAWRPRDTLAARFKFRGELDMSQREFALATGIPVSQIQSIEDGKSPRGLDVKVKLVVDAFKVDRDWLMLGRRTCRPHNANPAGWVPPPGLEPGTCGLSARRSPLSCP